VTNYYTKFSSSLKIESDREKDWCIATLSKLEEELDDDGISKADFEWSYDPEEKCIYFVCDDSANIDQIASFVQEFLKEFHQDRWWYLEWSRDCSSMRLDGFGGGAIFVTVNSIETIDTYHWIETQAEQYKTLKSLNGD
jgi:hypothetical protein